MMRKRYVPRRTLFCAFVTLFAFLASYLMAQPDFSDWSAPTNLGPVINSAFRDVAPAISRDRLSLYFSSNRPGGISVPGTPSSIDLYVSRRNSLEEPWGPPTNLGALINTSSIETGAALSRDEHWLFFQSDRSDGFGGLDLWASYRERTHDDFGWQSPVNLGPGVNSAFEDTLGGYFENDDHVPHLFFSSNRPGIGLADFYVSELLPDGTFSSARLIPELSSTVADVGLIPRFDGLEVFFFSSRSGGFGGQDLWAATRKTVLDPWSAPENLGPLVNSGVTDQRPYIAPDRQTLYFGSDRIGGFGGFDLYVTTRAK
jgi:hypothetical protein